MHVHVLWDQWFQTRVILGILMGFYVVGINHKNYGDRFLLNSNTNINALLIRIYLNNENIFPFLVFVN